MTRVNETLSSIIKKFLKSARARIKKRKHFKERVIKQSEDSLIIIELETMYKTS